MLKDKLIWGMELREDLLGFALLQAAWAAGPNAGVVVSLLVATFVSDDNIKLSKLQRHP